MLSKSQISALIRAIYNGKVNVLNLPVRLYKEIAEYLTKGVYKGYGNTLLSVAYDSPDYEMLETLRTNVYLFSGAKTFNYVLSTENLIVEGDEVLPFSEFKKRAQEVYKEFNDTWLQAEYDTAIGQAQSAREELRFQVESDIFPWLEYVAVIDANTSDVCRAMNGYTGPVNDPIWKTHSPLNHYRCRCLKRQKRTGVQSIKEGLIMPPEEFQFNPGQKREIFDKNHPYFDVPAKYHKFAKRNFNMPLPDADKP